MRMIIHFTIFIITLISPFYVSANGGLSLSQTRVVFTSDKESTSLNVKNSSSRDVWLLRGWVDDKDGKAKNDIFIITPPLYRLDAERDIQLRVNVIDKTSLPRDIESVFYINILAIPPSDTDLNNGENLSSIKFAINNRIKLFYRPIEINNKNEIVSAYSKIIAKKISGGVLLTNNSPYYITLYNTKINGKSVQGEEDYMLSPRGQRTIQFSGAITSVDYKVINDYGGKSENYHMEM